MRDRLLRVCWGGWDVDHFSRTGIVQLLAGFLLNGFGIGFQPLDLILIGLALLLEVGYFFLQCFDLGTLLLVHDHPIRAEDNVEEESCREDNDGHSGYTTA